MTQALLALYCLDANFFIEGWNKYYSPQFCSDYWDVINDLGKKGIIFIPSHVKEEIAKTDDDLNKWLKKSHIPVRTNDEEVDKCLKRIYAANSSHARLVDNTKGRSAADPWVIAHALNVNATVVTKEEKVTNPTSQRIKIPNVCDNMGIKWINDFEFIREVNIKFSCRL